MTDEELQRLFLFFPVFVVFYLATINSLNVAGLLSYKKYIDILITIQVCTHVFLLISKKTCNPSQGSKFCNYGAGVIGFLYFIIIVQCFGRKWNIVTVFSLLVILYMILSHFITIYPLKLLFEYAGVKLPINRKNTYILMISNMFHEKKLQTLLHSLLKDGGSLVDAGAYIGDTSIFLAKNFPQCDIYAIEPSILNCKYINSVKEINEFKNLHVINTLLSNSEEVYSVTKENLPNASYKTDKSDKSENNGIKSTTLDTMISQNIIKNNVKVLHYDVEGMELDVLKGSENIIKRNKPYIIVEMLKENNDLIFYLSSLGYSYEIIDENVCFGDFFDTKHCRNYLFKA